MPDSLTYGSLFSGIGGLDLGLDRAGWTCKFQVEIDPYARRVLAKHWPEVPKHDDIKTFPPTPDGWGVDLIAGGFPCQDVSSIGERAGIKGERSGLWFEMARIVRVLRPRFVLVENVSDLLVRGLDGVLGSLAALGYHAQWELLPAAAFGAAHVRSRLFVIAYADGVLCEPWGRICGSENLPRPPQRRDLERRARDARASFSPRVGGDVHGVPARVDRLRGLGNAVVPQVAEWLGLRIAEVARG